MHCIGAQALELYYDASWTLNQFADAWFKYPAGCLELCRFYISVTQEYPGLTTADRC